MRCLITTSVGTGFRAGTGFPVFLCTRGRIVKLNKLCNGVKDCHNGDDEINMLCESEFMSVISSNYCCSMEVLL